MSMTNDVRAYHELVLLCVLFFFFSVDETEVAVFRIIDGIGSDTPITPITLTYNVYNLLVDGLLSKGINVQQNLPRILQQIDENIVLPNKISNLTRKIRKYLEAGGDGNDTVKEICQDPCNDLPDIFVKYGIKTEVLISKTISPPDHPIYLTNSDVLYLRRLLYYKNLPWTHAEYWINVLVCGTTSHFETPTAKEIRQQWNGIHEKFHSFRTSGSPAASKELSSLMLDNYHLPSKREMSNKMSVERIESEISAQQKMKKLCAELVNTYSSLIDANEEIYELTLTNVNLEGKIKNSDKLEKEIKQKLNPRNVNKRLQRCKKQVENLQSQVSNQQDTFNNRIEMIMNENIHLERELEALKVKLDQQKIKFGQASKMKGYYKGKCGIQVQKTKEVKSKLVSCEKEMGNLQKEVDYLHDTMRENKLEKLELFQDGKYKSEIRQVYMDLLSSGVSIEKCETVVRSVLNNLLDVQVDRLPKKSLASIMAIEAQILSQAQAAEAMLQYENNCLHLDGTKKRFVEYGGFQISTEVGSFSLNHKAMPSGDACSYIEATKETFTELAESISADQNEKEKLEAKLFMSIKNIMTDRHTVNKSYKKLLQKEKEAKIDLLDVNMTEEERDAATSVNGLFCGLHILPNMATAACKGLKDFELENKISSDSIFDSNSVANNLIYEVCKAFIEISGCQKSGDGLEFNDYLANQNQKNYLVTFLHNRFNVLFLDGGAVFYHRNHIAEYLNSGRSSKSNKLLKSIQDRINNKMVLAECRALGIIGKIICGPLWRILEDESVSFFKMNEYWQVLVEKFEEFSNDSTALLRGEPIFNTESIINKDPVYKSLFDKHNDLDDITKIVFIAISKQICPMLKRQLSDQFNTRGSILHTK